MTSFVISRNLADYCFPSRMALIVYDMQVGICSQVACGQQITGKVARVIESARAASFPVIYTRHMSIPRRLMGAFQLRQAMAWQRTDDPEQVQPWFLPESEGFQIVPELVPREDEAVLDKIAFSAFEGTPLSMILRDLGLISFAICGIAMEIGIDPTIRHGSDLGLVPIVISDACGAGHPEAAERAHASIDFLGDAICCDVAGITEQMERATAIAPWG
jgi:nicotinamidase-related amidase